jgi:uncharacterized protein DUF736
MGVSPGEESRFDSVASQTIEAQPVFGQIKPSQRPGASRAETQSWEKRWLISVTLYKRSEQLGVEKETQCGKWRSRCLERPPRATSLQSMRSRTEIDSTRSGCSEEGRDYLSLKFDDPSFNAPIYANLFDDEGGEEITPLAWRPRELAEDCRRPPCPFRLVGVP